MFQPSVSEPRAGVARMLATGGFFRIDDFGGILVVRLFGSASKADADGFFEIFQPLLHARAPARVLVDVTDAEDLAYAARWDLAKRLKQNRGLIARSAVIGLRHTTELIFRVVIRVSRRDDIQAFDSFPGAVRWLSHRAS